MLVRSLTAVDRIAPLATGPGARANLALCTALGRFGEKTQVVTRLTDPDSHLLGTVGMARRLDPLTVQTPDGPVELVIFEGNLGGGDVPTWVITGAKVADPTIAALAMFELCRASESLPELLRADSDWSKAITEAQHLDNVPATVLMVDQPDGEMSSSLAEAIACADAVVLPSASGVRELASTGEGPLAEALAGRMASVIGINPGAHSHSWSASSDPHLPVPFEPTPTSKANLRREIARTTLGLPASTAPLICAVGPFDFIDRDATELLKHSEAQIVFLHSSDHPPVQRESVATFCRSHPTKARLVPITGSALHQAVAAADLMLFAHLPTLGERHPLWCMGYGTVPIGPRAGLLADQLVDWDAATQTGSGFLFPGHRPEDMPAAVRRAIRAVSSTGWKTLVARVAATDLSWPTAGLRHGDLGQRLVRRRRELGPQA